MLSVNLAVTRISMQTGRSMILELVRHFRIVVGQGSFFRLINNGISSAVCNRTMTE